MKLGKIVGTVVSTQKDRKLEGLRFYLVRDLSISLEETASFLVAADSVGAGVGEVVLPWGGRGGEGVRGGVWAVWRGRMQRGGQGCMTPSRS